MNSRSSMHRLGKIIEKFGRKFSWERSAPIETSSFKFKNLNLSLWGDERTHVGSFLCSISTKLRSIGTGPPNKKNEMFQQKMSVVLEQNQMRFKG